LGAIANLILGVVVYRQRPHARVARAFAFLALMLVPWNLNFFFLSWLTDRDLAFAVTRWCRVASSFVAPAVLTLILCLRERRQGFWWLLLAIDYLFSIVLSVAIGLDLVVVDLRPSTWGFASVGGPFYAGFTFSILVNFVMAATVLVRDYRTIEEPRTRQQLRFWCLGAAVALPLGVTNLLPAYGIPFYPLGSLGSAAWAAIVAYAIVRHRLMDIDVVVTKGVAFSGVSLAVIAPAFGFILWLQHESFGRIHPDFSFASLFLLVAVGLLFPTLRIRAESRIERSLFREKHEYRAVLAAFTRSIVRILDRERLIKELTNTVSGCLQLDRMVVALADDNRRTIAIECSAGTPPVDREFADSHPLVRLLVRRQESILRDELAASEDPVERGELRDVCSRNGWEICIPLFAASGIVGFMALGRKRNLDTFSSGDVELLETLAAEASVALENARLYDELRRSQEIIRRADRLSALGTLAAGIAHEVRNPLVSIQTFFQLAPDRLHDEEFFSSFLPIAANEVKRISSLINELLSFARSPARALGSVSLNEMLERVVTLLEPEAHKHQVRIVTVPASDVPLIQADLDQIKQVLINLVLNAIQASKAGGIVTLSTQLVVHQNLPCGRIQVSDQGRGIPADQLEHIFVPFYTTKDKGTGLGLAIANQIVSEHGGFITVESEEGIGSVFKVDIPASDAIAAGQRPDLVVPNTRQRRAAG
jgi:signal transduction histidine kinase